MPPPIKLRTLIYLISICIVLLLVCQIYYLANEYALLAEHKYNTYIVRNYANLKKSNEYEIESEDEDDGENFRKIWPEENKRSDRIIEQLEYVPKDLKPKPVVIYLPSGLGRWNIGPRENIFESLQCKVKNCRFTIIKEEGESADAVLFYQVVEKAPKTRPKNQIWILYILENPVYTPSYRHLDYAINYSATYRYDSDIVAPYEKFRYLNDPGYKSTAPKVNYALKKTKMVAWFVSNCFTSNDRQNYVKQLQKYIPVDIYGHCGTMKCSRQQSDDCYKLLRTDYKFYLSFENANCQDYITEKFYVNGLQNDIIPIVMGAHKREYQRVAPKNSFIHVDEFENAESLAKYLKYLDKNGTAYNEYFEWKHKDRFEFMNTKFWCRACALLNDPIPKVYKSFDDWWRGPGVCHENRVKS